MTMDKLKEFQVATIGYASLTSPNSILSNEIMPFIAAVDPQTYQLVIQTDNPYYKI